MTSEKDRAYLGDEPSNESVQKIRAFLNRICATQKHFDALNEAMARPEHLLGDPIESVVAVPSAVVNPFLMKKADETVNELFRLYRKAKRILAVIEEPTQ